MRKMMYVSMAFALVLTLVAGCAGLKKKSDEELIRETMQTIKTALESKNIDLLMTVVSDQFEHPEVGGKAEAKEMLQMAVDAGYADDGECNLDSMEITMNPDGTASVYPVDLSGAPGSVSVEFVLKKEADGVWRVVGGDADV